MVLDIRVAGTHIDNMATLTLGSGMLHTEHLANGYLSTCEEQDNDLSLPVETMFSPSEAQEVIHSILLKVMIFSTRH
jgi:hypothetical protein